MFSISKLKGAMVQGLSCRRVLCTIIAGALLCAETASGFTRQQGGGIAVAFLGLKCTNIDPVVQTRLRVGILGSLYQNEYLSVISPEQVARIVGNDRIDGLLNTLSADSLAKLANELNVEYVFAGQLRSLAEDSTHSVLEGALVRYDRSANTLQSSRVLRYADEFDLEIANLKRNLVDTITPTRAGFFTKYWPILLIGSIAIGGAILIISSNASQSTAGGQSNPPPPTH